MSKEHEFNKDKWEKKKYLIACRLKDSRQYHMAKNLDNLNQIEYIEIEGKEPEFERVTEVVLTPYIIYQNENNGRVMLSINDSEELDVRREKTNVENIEPRKYAIVDDIKYPTWSNILPKTKKIKKNDKTIIDKLLSKVNLYNDKYEKKRFYKSMEHLIENVDDEKIIKDFD
jgi:hypothetical protein